MSAIDSRLGTAFAMAGVLFSVQCHSARAQTSGQEPTRTADKATSPIKFKLTQAAAPNAKPWEEPAVLSYTIDRKGKDSFNIELNGELNVPIYADSEGTGPVVEAFLGPSISYKRNSATGTRADALEIGIVGKYSRDARLFGQRPEDRPVGDKLFFTIEASANYAREGIYPDRSTPPCDTNTTSAFCRKQFSEKVQGSVDFYPYFRSFEGKGSVAHSFRPRFQLAHDTILDGAINSTTGTKITGGYTSILAGAGLNLSPSFIDPQFEFNVAATVRRRIGASPSRVEAIDRTESRMQMSATYFVTPPSDENHWRAGLSVIWAEGGDSFANRPKESTIVLAFRIGRF